MGRQLSSNEVLASIWVSIAVATAALAHVLLWFARYRLSQLYAGVVARLLPRGQLFSKLGPPLQWLAVLSLAAWPVFLALAVWQMSVENWRVAALGGTIAASALCSSFGAACFAADLYRLGPLSMALFAASATFLGGFFILFVWVIKPFSFIGSSVTLLCSSALPSIAIAFLVGPWQGSMSVELCLADASALASRARAGALPQRPWVRRALLAAMCLGSVATLGLYGVTVYRSNLPSDLDDVGFVLAACVLLLDALVWHLWNLGLVLSATQTAFLMVAGRVAACAWGERYWLIGHSCIFLVMAIMLSHVTMIQALPVPDHSKVERQRLAAEMLGHLDLPVPAAPAGGGQPQPVVVARGLRCILQPGWVYLVVVLAFSAEVAVVHFKSSILLPEISMCPTCDSRRQPLYAVAALGAGVLYLVSVALFHWAMRRAAGRPVVEASPAPLALVYLCWVGFSVYVAWLVGSWSVLIHAAILPLILVCFVVGYQRFVEDDFRLTRPAPTIPSGESSAKVHPAPDPALPADLADPAAPADPAVGAGGGAAADPVAEASGCVSRLGRGYRRLMMLPLAVRMWGFAFVLLAAYGGALHGTLDAANRWVGWTIAVAYLILALTFLSNRLWFGTLRLCPEQPLLWLAIVLALSLWAVLMWLLHLDKALNMKAFALLCILILYPVLCADIMAVQVARDAGWSLKELGTRNFVLRATIASVIVYAVLWGVVAVWSWGVSVLGFSALAVLGILAAAGRKWHERGRHLSTRMIVILDSVLALLTLIAAVGIAVFFRSIFGGFSVLCGGFVLVSGGAGLFKAWEAQNETKLQRLRATPHAIFPIYRFAGNGRMATSQSAVLCALSALAVTACWGFVAAAVLTERPYVGVVVGVLALEAAFVLLCRLAFEGGAVRQALLDLPAMQKLNAVRDCLEVWHQEAGAAKVDPSAPGGAADTVAAATSTSAVASDPVPDLQAMQTKVDGIVRDLAESQRSAKELLDAQVATACAGRFSTLPFVSMVHSLSTCVGLCRSGRGCLAASTPAEPLEAQLQLREALDVWCGVLHRQLRFGARLQLCLMSTNAQWLWAKEAEFKSFLKSTGSGPQSLTFEDFQQLPDELRQQIHDAWGVWKQKKAQKEAEDERRRKEEEEGARRRAEEMRKRRDEARVALAQATSQADVPRLEEALEAAREAGLAEDDSDVELASQRLKGLEEAAQALDAALASLEVAALEDAISLATLLGLVDDRLRRAQQELDRLVAAAKAEAEARKKAEEELLRRKREADERRRREAEAKEEEERKRKAAAVAHLLKHEEVKAALVDAVARNDVPRLKDALDGSRALGLGQDTHEVAQAIQVLGCLEDAIKVLDLALVSSDAKALKAAIAQANSVRLADGRVHRAQQELDRLAEAAKADAEAKKKAEEERIRRQKEAEERRKQAEAQEDDRKRKAAGAAAKCGVKVIEVDIEEIKKKCETGKYFDATFSKANMGNKVNEYEVKRMTDFCDKVQLKTDGFMASDINQGSLGDCWFLSAMACVADKQKIDCLFRYANEEQGVYVVRFFKDGVYRDVVVDDFFPTMYNQCAFAKSGKKGEAWVQVIEKAYAKLHGSFDAIVGGWVSDGLVDMTGGIGDLVRLSSISKELHDGTLWNRLKQLSQQGHLLGCGSQSGSDTDISSLGIVQGHAYSILRVEEVDGLQLMKLRNPWGSTEWKGKWSDSDQASWTQRMKAKLDYKDGGDDGEFWICFEDWTIQYAQLYICRVFGDGWNSILLNSAWKGATAGGCQGPTFENNPKFRLNVTGRIKLIIVVSQKDTRGSGKGSVDICIACNVYKAGASGPDLWGKVASSGTYTNSRQVVIEEEIPESSGKPYYLIAATYDKGEENDFSVQVFWQGAEGVVKFYAE